LLTPPCARAEGAPPLNIHGLDVSNGGYEIGYLVTGRGVAAPVADIVLGWCLFAVFDFGHFGAVPAGESGQFSASQARIFANVAQAVAESFARLVK
jgi:hypothetical protein